MHLYTDFAATLKALADDGVKRRLAAGEVEIVVSASPAEYARYVVRETQKWEKAVRESGATPE